MKKYKEYYINDVTPLNGGVKVTYLGVSSLLVDDGQTQLLIDCFFTRPGLIRTFTSKISTNTRIVDDILVKFGMERLKAIFISHSHYDHSFDAAYVAAKTRATLYGSTSTWNIGKGGGLRDDQLEVFESGQKFQYNKFTITVFESKHSPTQFPLKDDTKEVISEPLIQPAGYSAYAVGGTFDFLIKHKDKFIFVKPSANCLPGKLNGLNADVLFLGVGSLGKQDDTFKNNYYHETVGTLKPEIVMPVHWDNFFKPFSANMGVMPGIMDKTHKAFDFLIRKTESDNVKFNILQGGSSVVLFQE